MKSIPAPRYNKDARKAEEKKMDAKTDLIRVLREKNGTVSSRELAQRLGVSVRSIVNYVFQSGLSFQPFRKTAGALS